MKSSSKIATVSLSYCKHSKLLRHLRLASEFAGMPRQLYIESHHTGRKVLFKAVELGDPMFNMDGWDGEMCFYRPTEPLPNVEYLVIYNEY
jgi:hypothetical protein